MIYPLDVNYTHSETINLGVRIVSCDDNSNKHFRVQLEFERRIVFYFNQIRLFPIIFAKVVAKKHKQSKPLYLKLVYVCRRIVAGDVDRLVITKTYHPYLAYVGLLVLLALVVSSVVETDGLFVHSPGRHQRMASKQ